MRRLILAIVAAGAVAACSLAVSGRIAVGDDDPPITNCP